MNKEPTVEEMIRFINLQIERGKSIRDVEWVTYFQAIRKQLEKPEPSVVKGWGWLYCGKCGEKIWVEPREKQKVSREFVLQKFLPCRCDDYGRRLLSSCWCPYHDTEWELMLTELGIEVEEEGDE